MAGTLEDQFCGNNFTKTMQIPPVCRQQHVYFPAGYTRCDLKAGRMKTPVFKAKSHLNLLTGGHYVPFLSG